MGSVSGRQRVQEYKSVLQCVEGEEKETRVLQCVAVCCSVLQESRNIVLRCVAVCCSVLQGLQESKERNM